MLLRNNSSEQLESGSNVLHGDGGGGGIGGIQLKKGPWTAAEDAILTEYVTKHGEGNWNTVQRSTGLARCGKSCRLRWANHLRPNLKKGAFSPEEERLIVELHAQLGNKWARMAAQLPGRTDNEIKNYWNTRVKRRHRQGLPLYPPEIQQQQQRPSYSHLSYHSQPTTPTTPTSSFSFRTATTTPNTPTANPHPYPPPCYASSPSTSLSPTPPPLSPNLQSPHHPAFRTLTLFDTNNNNNSNVKNVFNIPRTPPTLQNPPRFKRFHSDTNISNVGTATINNSINNNYNGIGSNNVQGPSSNFSLPFSPFLRSPSSFSLLSGPQNHCNTITFSNTGSKLLSLPSFSSLPVSFSGPNSSSIFRTLDEKDCTLTNGSFFALNPELPSSQLLSQNGNAELNFDNEKLSVSCSGSGLLEDLLEEAHALACNFGESSIRFSEEKREFSGFNQWNDSSSLNLSSATRPKEEAGGQINNMHEGLSKLPNVIPSMQVPEWCADSGEASNCQSSVVTDENIGLEMQQIASLFRVDANTEQPRPPGSCSFDNLPGIC